MPHSPMVVSSSISPQSWTPTWWLPPSPRPWVSRRSGRAALLERLTAFLRDAQCLLVLDNFEQVVDAAALVAALVAECPRLRVLVTSRVRLRLSDEREIPVLPLPFPETDEPASACEVDASAAVRLFVTRAQAVKPDFVLTEQNASAVGAICRRLDGLPLAIELAAARVKIFSPTALLARLDQRLPLLTEGGRDLPARQRTMRDAIAWSYDLLTPEEQTAFRQLAVFVGGFTLEAAEAVAGLDAASPMFTVIASLVDNSLVLQEPDADDEPRFRMLETVREYGLEQLEATGDADAIGRAARGLVPRLGRGRRCGDVGPEPVAVVGTAQCRGAQFTRRGRHGSWSAGTPQLSSVYWERAASSG